MSKVIPQPYRPWGDNTKVVFDADRSYQPKEGEFRHERVVLIQDTNPNTGRKYYELKQISPYNGKWDTSLAFRRKNKETGEFYPARAEFKLREDELVDLGKALIALGQGKDLPDANADNVPSTHVPDAGDDDVPF